jgi:hypothetical protein
MVLKIAYIASFAVSNNSPINGQTITLTCVAIGEKKPKFTFSSSGYKTVDPAFFEEVATVEETESGTTYTAKYVIKSIAPTVLISGHVIKCTVSHMKISLIFPKSPS